MNWKEFITHITQGALDNNRYSDYALSNKTGVDRAAFYKLKKGDTLKPQQNTVEAIEKAFDIKINDSDPNDITYTKNFIAKEQPEKYGIRNTFNVGIATKTISKVGSLQKGLKDMNSVNELLAYEITNTDDTELYTVGDTIILDVHGIINNNDTIIIKMIDEKILIRKCILDENFILIFNQKEKLLEVDKIDFINIDCYYKVLGKIQIN